MELDSVNESRVVDQKGLEFLVIFVLVVPTGNVLGLTILDKSLHLAKRLSEQSFGHLGPRTLLQKIDSFVVSLLDGCVVEFEKLVVEVLEVIGGLRVVHEVGDFELTQNLQLFFVFSVNALKVPLEYLEELLGEGNDVFGTEDLQELDLLEDNERGFEVAQGPEGEEGVNQEDDISVDLISLRRI